MRLAIISDIHANLEALEKTLSLMKPLSVDTIICLGDIVGYGANPKECLNLTREFSNYFVPGNHDIAACDLSQISQFNIYASESIIWTNQILSENEKKFLKELCYKIEFEDFTFVHSSPYHPDEWYYIENFSDASFSFRYFSNKICFIGHTHEAIVFTENYDEFKILNSLKISKEKDITVTPYKLNPKERYIINVGSVGQPRDLDWRLSFGIFDTKEWIYENVRSKYDVTLASKKIKDAGLPLYLANRLFHGK